MPLRVRLSKLWWNFLSRRKFIRKIVSEELTDALHPEFGWAWDEDGDFGRVLKERDERLDYLTKCLKTAEAERDHWKQVATDYFVTHPQAPFMIDRRPFKK